MKSKSDNTARPTTLGATVQKARRKLGKRLEALAAEAGLGLSTVRRVESGEVIPHRATLLALAAALELDASDLEKLAERRAS